MRVLLTGGAGFIGSHVAESLLESGNEVAIVDNLEPFYSPAVKQANLSEVSRVGEFGFFDSDIRDFDQLSKICGDFRPTIVIHLAARAGVRPSIEDPCGYQHTNIGGTQNILELCRVFNVERLVFGSSSSVYGDSTHAPFSEDQVDLRPISPYAATKLAC
jgi:UDP-glucuronate 4-epimerase